MPQLYTPTASEERTSPALTLSSTLNDLRTFDFQIDESEVGEKIFHAFQKDASLPGAILTQQSNLRGFVSRSRFLEILIRPFGRRILLRRSLDKLFNTNPSLRDNITILPVDMPIFEAARICLQRPSKFLYEPIVVDIGKQTYRIIALQDILVAQSQICQVALLTIQERSLELATANEEIITLKERLKQDNLRKMQMMILPRSRELENIAGLDLAGYMEPADEVGGDYYDVLELDGVVTLGIGDVTGHGLESGILMLMTQTVVRTLREIGEGDPVKFLDVLNRAIYKNLQRMNSEMILTLAIVNYANGKISISGQHEEILLVRNNGTVERIDTMDLGFPIGLDAEIADFINQVTFDLQLGDGVVLYTDGIPEAKDINKVQYGVEKLCEVISENWHKAASEIKDSVIADVLRHIGTQEVFDDITLLVMKRNAKVLEDVE